MNAPLPHHPAVAERLFFPAEEAIVCAMTQTLRNAAPHLSPLVFEEAPGARAHHYRAAGVAQDLDPETFARLDARAVKYLRIWHGLFRGWGEC